MRTALAIALGVSGILLLLGCAFIIWAHHLYAVGMTRDYRIILGLVVAAAITAIFVAGSAFFRPKRNIH